MRIVHRVTLNWSAQVRRELAALANIPLAEPRHPDITTAVTFEVDESAEFWPAVRDWMKRRRIGAELIYTTFSVAEIAEAHWLHLHGEFVSGFPFPRPDDDGYLHVTYDLSDYCSRCGIGLRQKAPFMMKSEPRWGRRSIKQLHWVPDEFFVTPAAWNRVFGPHGIASRPVTGRGARMLETVLQLNVVATVELDTDGLAPQRCSTCGGVKYEPPAVGYSPAIRRAPPTHAAMSDHYFGYGAQAFRLVIVSQALTRAIQAADLNGASFRPTKPVARG